MIITDCHIHIQPMELFKPEALALMKKSRKDFDLVAEYCSSPKAFLSTSTRLAWIARADQLRGARVIGFTPAVNEFIANYVKADPKRLIPCGSVHPRHTHNVLADMEQMCRLGSNSSDPSAHQLLYPNDYVNGVKELEIIYRAAEATVFPSCAHRHVDFSRRAQQVGDPIYVDDVARRFSAAEDSAGPRGRPLWMDTAFFLVRRTATFFSTLAAFHPRRC